MKTRSLLGALLAVTSLFSLTTLSSPTLGQSGKPASDKKPQTQTQSAQQAPHPARVQIVYSLRALPAGTMLKPQDVTAIVVDWANAPGDAAPSLASVIGKKTVKFIGQSQIISVLDIGQKLTKEMKEKVLIRDYSRYREAMSQIVFAKAAVPAGGKFSIANLAMAPIPQRLVPQDAISHPGLVDRHKCKFGVTKFQIVTQHDIDATK